MKKPWLGILCHATGLATALHDPSLQLRSESLYLLPRAWKADPHSIATLTRRSEIENWILEPRAFGVETLFARSDRSSPSRSPRSAAGRETGQNQASASTSHSGGGQRPRSDSSRSPQGSPAGSPGTPRSTNSNGSPLGYRAGSPIACPGGSCRGARDGSRDSSPVRSRSGSRAASPGPPSVSDSSSGTPVASPRGGSRQSSGDNQRATPMWTQSAPELGPGSSYQPASVSGSSSPRRTPYHSPPSHSGGGPSRTSSSSSMSSDMGDNHVHGIIGGDVDARTTTTQPNVGKLLAEHKSRLGGAVEFSMHGTGPVTGKAVNYQPNSISQMTAKSSNPVRAAISSSGESDGNLSADLPGTGRSKAKMKGSAQSYMRVESIAGGQSTVSAKLMGAGDMSAKAGDNNE